MAAEFGFLDTSEGITWERVSWPVMIPPATLDEPVAPDTKITCVHIYGCACFSLLVENITPFHQSPFKKEVCLDWFPTLHVATVFHFFKSI